jgi:hypothetical protein
VGRDCGRAAYLALDFFGSFLHQGKKNIKKYGQKDNHLNLLGGS